jgi:hypothetical protein
MIFIVLCLCYRARVSGDGYAHIVPDWQPDCYTQATRFLEPSHNKTSGSSFHRVKEEDHHGKMLSLWR